MIDTADKQKLDFLENLLKTNEQIKLQFFTFLATKEQFEQSLENDDSVTLVEDIFGDFEAIDIDSFVEHEYCHCDGYLSDDYYEMQDAILEDAFAGYKSAIDSYVENMQIYEATSYLSAIYKALLLKPEFADDNYYVFDGEFVALAITYLKNMIENIAIKLQTVVISNNLKEKIIEHLIDCISENFKLDIFTSFLNTIIQDKTMSDMQLKNITLFPILTKLHICEMLNDDAQYITYAMQSYQNNITISELLLSKLSSLNRYKEYEQISQNLFEENPRHYSPIILEVLQYDKSKDLYINALKQRSINKSSLEDYKELKQYLNNNELTEFRQRVEQTYQKKFYVDILEYEKIYDKILEIANKNIDCYELDYFIKPIKDVFPKEVYEIVIKSCNKALNTTNRSRSTYKTMTTWLKVIVSVEQIKDELKDYIQTNLYNHQPRLPALRDELSKAKLI